MTPTHAKQVTIRQLDRPEAPHLTHIVEVRHPATGCVVFAALATCEADALRQGNRWLSDFTNHRPKRIPLR